jgi:MinD superfamily P-loop ATPase
MRTVVVVSGKGGTGKTSVASGLVPFLPRPVLADADVDASNLPLVFHMEPVRSEPFRGGRIARVDPGLCAGCHECVEACRFHALSASRSNGEPPAVDGMSCEGCGACRIACPLEAIEMIEVVTGEIVVSTTAFGSMVHGRLGPGGENSGALVAQVRKEAARIAEERRRQWILVDGPPGTGCPAISSLTGADLALVVTEPTPSGESDLLRVLDLSRRLRVPAAVVINKADLCPERSDDLAGRVESAGVPVLARFPYDENVSVALGEHRLLSDRSAAWRRRFRNLGESIARLLGEAETTARLARLVPLGDGERDQSANP